MGTGEEFDRVHSVIGFAQAGEVLELLRVHEIIAGDGEGAGEHGGYFGVPTEVVCVEEG